MRPVPNFHNYQEQLRLFLTIRTSPDFFTIGSDQFRSFSSFHAKNFEISRKILEFLALSSFRILSEPGIHKNLQKMNTLQAYPTKRYKSKRKFAKTLHNIFPKSYLIESFEYQAKSHSQNSKHLKKGGQNYLRIRKFHFAVTA